MKTSRTPAVKRPRIPPPSRTSPVFIADCSDINDAIVPHSLGEDNQNELGAGFIEKEVVS
jgi:hypothetical protein